MLKHPRFTPRIYAGQSVQIIQPSNQIMIDSCEANIGHLSGSSRSIPAILCDGSDDSEQWRLMNVIDSTGALLDHIAIKGAVSGDQAVRLCDKYMPELKAGRIRNTVSMSETAMKTFLDGASIPSGTPFVLESDAMMLDSIGSTKPAEWRDGRISSHGGSITQLMLDMRRCDPEGQLVELMTPRDIVGLVIDDSCELGPMLDAMIIKNRNLDTTIQRLAEALKQFDNDEFFVKSVTPIAPFKRLGVVNVGAIFTMSDTQTITVLFNNPDTTPAKLSEDDILTSWKWMLNRRDVTAILQPRAVDAKKFAVIAERMTRLLARNHMKFQDAQSARLKDELLLAELVGQVEAKQLELRTMDASIQSTQLEIDAEATRKLNQTDIGMAGKTGTNEQNVQMNNEENIVKKANDLQSLLISEHGFSIDTMATKGEHTLNLISPHQKHLAIIAKSDEANNTEWTIDLSSGGEIANLEEIDKSQSIEQIAQQIVEADNQNPNTVNEQDVQLSGDEFGEFNLPEDIKQLRAMVKTTLSEMIGKAYPCPALSADVEIRKSGIKKILSTSADPRKLQAIAGLKDLLHNAVKVDQLEPYDKSLEANIKAYHILESALALDGQSVQVRFVIREDDKGHYHYDHTIDNSVLKNAKSPLLDGLLTTVFPMAGVVIDEDHQKELARLANCQLGNSIENNQTQVNGMLDGLNGAEGIVLNMFIVDSEQDEQNVQMNKTENTALYEIKNGRKKEGTIKVTKDGDTYTAFVAIAGVGGEHVADLNQVKSWLTVRLQRLGESVEGASLSWERTASRLKLKSGEDYLNLSEEFVTFEEMATVTSKVDLAGLISKKLSEMEGWMLSGNIAIRDVTLNDQKYRYKFNYSPLTPKKEFRIDELLLGVEPLDYSIKQAIVTYGMFTPSREGVELAVKSLFEGVNSHIEHQLENNTQVGEQNVQMNNEQNQGSNAVSEDQQFLERVIAGTEDMSSADFGDKLIALAENLDPALEALFEQAADVYANYAISLEV